MVWVPYCITTAHKPINTVMGAQPYLQPCLQIWLEFIMTPYLWAVSSYPCFNSTTHPRKPITCMGFVIMHSRWCSFCWTSGTGEARSIAVKLGLVSGDLGYQEPINAPLLPVAFDQHHKILCPTLLPYKQPSSWDWGLKTDMRDHLSICWEHWPRQMKYASVSSVFWYHLFMFSKPLWIASWSSANFGMLAVLTHVCCRNSTTGIIHQATASWDLEKDCCAVAGSCCQWSVTQYWHAECTAQFRGTEFQYVGCLKKCWKNGWV